MNYHSLSILKNIVFRHLSLIERNYWSEEEEQEQDVERKRSKTSLREKTNGHHSDFVFSFW